MLEKLTKMAVSDRPNVLIIMSDQHNRGFMGCAGHPLVQTPNLDALAGCGTLFTQAYCNSPLCGPSRMAFMSAQLPSSINCLTNTDPLDSNVPTFAHAFAAAGYETVLCGRMHFEGPDQRHGFQRRLVGDVCPRIDDTTSAPPLRHVLGDLSSTTGPNTVSIKLSGAGESGYLEYDRVVTKRAVEWLTARGKQTGASPFLLTVGYVQPHAPFVAPQDDFQLYDAKITTADLPAPGPRPLHPELQRLRGRAGLDDPQRAPTQEEERRARVAYHGMCTFLDRQVGQVLDGLATSGMAANTIVVYLSDHGEMLGEHGMWWKHTFFESSVGVPLIMAGPGIPAGETIRKNVSLIDIGPTLLDLCQAPQIPSAAGRSFRCLWDGNADLWPDEVVAENLWPANSTTLHRMLRRGKWKLNTYQGFEPELYDVENDPCEQANLAADQQFKSVIDDLSRRLDQVGDSRQIVDRLARNATTRKWIVDGFSGSDQIPADPPWFDPACPPANFLLQ